MGLDLIKEIVKIRPNMGLVMYTVRDDVGLSHSLKALGVTYLTKPASRLGLGEAVRDATDKTEIMSIEGPTRMLIAEDTASVQDILKRQLDKLGVEADFVENGKEALKALNTGKYGILITDLHMPKLDGYGLVETIRKKEEAAGNGHFPVIVLTADVQMAQRETYLRHGFDECFLKPVSLGQFERLLIRWGLLAQDDSKIEAEQEDTAKEEEDALQTSAIDKDAMVAMMGAFDDAAIEMLGMFVEMTEPLVTSLRGAHDEGDSHQVAEIAHSLKGAARSACCNQLGDIAARLQDDAEKNSYDADLINQIEAAFEDVKKEVTAL